MINTPLKSARHQEAKALVNQIIKGIERCARTQSMDRVFRDWCASMALAMQNACLIPETPTWRANEDEYLAIVKLHGADTMLKFREMFEQYQEVLMLQPFDDWLGRIFMGLGGESNKGQFFTPYHVSLACAKLAVKKPADGEPITMNEPACGSSGMVIAMLEVLNDMGVDWQKRARIVCGDIDRTCVHMSYVTLSLMGVRAKVLHQDALRLKTWSVWHTPREMLWPIMDYDWSKPAENASECIQVEPDLTEEPKADENTPNPENVEKRKSEPKQMSLF